jgi:hypothetical protein
MALLATLTLALAVLFRSPSDYRIFVCIIVSLATISLAVRSLFIGKPVWALLFLAILGLFTPFQVSRLSYAFRSIVDMASLALFAASPFILSKSVLTVTPSER